MTPGLDEYLEKILAHDYKQQLSVLLTFHHPLEALKTLAEVYTDISILATSFAKMRIIIPNSAAGSLWEENLQDYDRECKKTPDGRSPSKVMLFQE